MTVKQLISYNKLQQPSFTNFKRQKEGSKKKKFSTPPTQFSKTFIKLIILIDFDNLKSGGKGKGGRKFNFNFFFFVTEKKKINLN